MNDHNGEHRREGKSVSLSLAPTVLLAIGVLLAPTLFLAQPIQPRNIAFFERVQAVDSERKVVTVKRGKIPDYTDAATTEYSIEEDAVLKRLQPGDDIRATVHPNDLTLRHIQIVYRRGPKQPPK
jgi:Cu/Ag efflux protein CusF